MNNQTRFIIYIMLAFIAAACGTQPPDREESVWCYKFDFTASDYGMIISDGVHTARGIESVNGVLGASYTHTSNVQADYFVAEIELIVPGPRQIAAYVSAFGVGQSINEQFSQSGIGYLTNEVPENEENLGSDTATVSASTSSDTTIIIRSLTVESATGSNPFGASNCNDLEPTETTTPNPSATPEPSETSTITVTPTETLTPTITLTPSPTIEPDILVTCEQQFDFRVANNGFAATGDNNGGSSAVRVNGIGWINGSNITNGGNTFYGPDIYWNRGANEVNDLYVWVDIDAHDSVNGLPTLLIGKSYNAILNETQSQLRAQPYAYAGTNLGYDVYHATLVLAGDEIIINPRAFYAMNTNTGDSVIAMAGINCDHTLPTPTPTPSPSPTPTETQTATPEPTTTETSGTQEPGDGTNTLTAEPTSTNTPTATLTPFPTNTPMATFTPMATRTLMPTPTFYPTATPDASATPNPDANDFSSDGTCEGYAGTEPDGTAETGQWVEWQFFGLENIVNCVIIPRMDWLGDLVNTIVAAVGSIYDMISNTFSYIRAAGEWLFGDFFHYAGGHISNFIAQIIYFLQTLIESIINTVVALVELVIALIEAVYNFIVNLLRFIQSALSYAGRLFDAWNNATPTTPPGLPDCQNAPLQHDICAVYYIMNNTVFAGIGAFIIPAITFYMSLLVAFSLLDGVIARIRKMWRVTD